MPPVRVSVRSGGRAVDAARQNGGSRGGGSGRSNRGEGSLSSGGVARKKGSSSIWLHVKRAAVISKEAPAQSLPARDFCGAD